MSTEFHEIERFLKQIKQPSLFSYLSLAPNADVETVRATLDQRRVWAQAQQANPRHREEALWFIRNRRLLERALVDKRGAYLMSLARASRLRALAHVRHFITVMGVNASTLPFIRTYGQRSGLSENLVEQLIERERPELCYSSAGFTAEVA